MTNNCRDLTKNGNILESDEEHSSLAAFYSQKFTRKIVSELIYLLESIEK